MRTRLILYLFLSFKLFPLYNLLFFRIIYFASTCFFSIYCINHNSTQHNFNKNPYLCYLTLSISFYLSSLLILLLFSLSPLWYFRLSIFNNSLFLLINFSSSAITFWCYHLLLLP
jgi:hypothetical protein